MAGSQTIGCLIGLRTLSMIWVLIAHSFAWIQVSTVEGDKNPFVRLATRGTYCMNRKCTATTVNSQTAITVPLLPASFLYLNEKKLKIVVCQGIYNETSRKKKKTSSI